MADAPKPVDPTVAAEYSGRWEDKQNVIPGSARQIPGFGPPAHETPAANTPQPPKPQ